MTEEVNWRKGRSVVYKNTIHLVFVTKYRRAVFTGEILTALEAIFRETCEQMGSELLRGVHRWRFAGRGEKLRATTNATRLNRAIPQLK